MKTVKNKRKAPGDNDKDSDKDDKATKQGKKAKQ